MGSIFIGLYRLFVRKTILFSGFVLLVAAVSIAGIKRLNITENIFAILPKGQEFQKFNTLLESKNISDQVVFSLSLAKTIGSPRLCGIETGITSLSNFPSAQAFAERSYD